MLSHGKKRPVVGEENVRKTSHEEKKRTRPRRNKNSYGTATRTMPGENTIEPATEGNWLGPSRVGKRDTREKEIEARRTQKDLVERRGEGGKRVCK